MKDVDVVSHSNLLLVLSVPGASDADDDPEFADMLADQFVHIINEERARNGGMDFEPVLVNAVPGPQLLTGAELAQLVAAIRDLDEATREACSHPNAAFTIGGVEDSDGYVWCPDCRTNLTDA